MTCLLELIWVIMNEETESNLIEIQRMDSLRIATWRIFRENIFYIFEKLNHQYKKSSPVMLI